MQKLFTFFLSLIFLFTISIIPAAAAQSTPTVFPQNQMANKDYFAAGETVVISGTVNGDAYIAGGDVIVDGLINGDLLAAGGTVTIRGKVRDNIRVVGGQIIVMGEVGRNITTVGGSVTIADSAKIHGSLTAGTGNLSIFAPIGKEANIAAGQITLGSIINGDLQAGVRQLTLTPQAVIRGNLTYWSSTLAQLDASAKISGKTIHNLPPKEQSKPKNISSKPSLLAGVGILSILSFLSAIMVGLLIVTIFPVFAKQTATIILEKPLQSLGFGFLSFLVFPFVFLLLLITLVGIPLDFILLTAFILCIYFAKFFISLALGHKILNLLKKKTTQQWTFIIGLIAYSLLTFLPIIGFILWMVTGLMGLGALLLSKKAFYIEMKKKNCI